MEVSIIILTYNSSKYIKGLLDSIISGYKKSITDGKLEIIIADNASTDATKSLVEEHKEFVHFLDNGGNLGFAKGINNACKKAKGEFLLFINPDAQITGGDLFLMVDEFKDEKVGVVGGRINKKEGGRELSCGKTYNWLNILLLSCGLEEKLGVRFAPEKEQKVDHVSGGFFAIRRSIFEKLRGFDEHYFMYVEDADLCFRVKKNGYTVLFSPKAVIQHVGQGSSNRVFAVVNIYKGLLYFQKEHMGSLSYLFVKLVLFLKAVLLVLAGKISNNQYLVETYEKALKVF